MRSLDSSDIGVDQDCIDVTLTKSFDSLRTFLLALSLRIDYDVPE